MHVDQLTKILNEYPPSRRLKVVVDHVVLLEMTVIEMLLKLEHDRAKAGDQPNLLLTYFGRADGIVRERITNQGGFALPLEWVELDLQ